MTISTPFIVDNQDDKLADVLSDAIKMGATQVDVCVGFFFLSGLLQLHDALANDKLKKIRLLIGSKTNNRTLEFIASSYDDPAMAAQEWKAIEARGQIAAERKARAEETRMSIEEQQSKLTLSMSTKEKLADISKWIQDGRLEIKVWWPGCLHAKCYVVHIPESRFVAPGLAVVGSSNLTLAGLTSNTELNMLARDPDPFNALAQWFEDKWNSKYANDFNAMFLDVLKRGWSQRLATPYEFYVRCLLAYFEDRLEARFRGELLLPQGIVLADFQEDAVRAAIDCLELPSEDGGGGFGGAMIADVVGLGKTYMALAVINYYRHLGVESLIVVPAALRENWAREAKLFQLSSVPIITHTEIARNPERCFEGRAYTGLVVVDESHRLRNDYTQTYENLMGFLTERTAPGSQVDRRVLLLTATPLVNSIRDVGNQLGIMFRGNSAALFRRDLGLRIPDLDEYFRQQAKLEEVIDGFVREGLRESLELRRQGKIKAAYNRRLNLIPPEPVLMKEWDNKYNEKNSSIILEGDPAYVPFPQPVHKALRRIVIRRLRSEFPAGKEFLLGDKKYRFPGQAPPQKIQYSLAGTYGEAVFDKILEALTGLDKDDNAVPGLTFAYFSVGLYLQDTVDASKQPYANLKRAGIQLRGLMKVLIIKRFESSWYAFVQTLLRLRAKYGDFLTALDDGEILINDDQVYDVDSSDDADASNNGKAVKYKFADFKDSDLRAAINADVAILDELIKLGQGLGPDKDQKLLSLISMLGGKSPVGATKLTKPQVRLASPCKLSVLGFDGKQREIDGWDLTKKKLDLSSSTERVVIFTEYRDTAEYIYENLLAAGITDIGVCHSAGTRLGDDGVKATSASGSPSYVSTEQAVIRFARKYNEGITVKDYASVPDDIRILISTDVLAEGYNLQSSRVVINYDLPWTAVRVMQRLGRVDRLKSPFDVVYPLHFFPSEEAEAKTSMLDRLVLKLSQFTQNFGLIQGLLDTTDMVRDIAGAYRAEHDRRDVISVYFENELRRDLEEFWASDPDKVESIRKLPLPILTGQAVSEPSMMVSAFIEESSVRLEGEALEKIADEITQSRLWGRIRCTKLDDALPSLHDVPAGASKHLEIIEAQRQSRFEAIKAFRLATQGQTTKKLGEVLKWLQAELLTCKGFEVKRRERIGELLNYFGHNINELPSTIYAELRRVDLPKKTESPEKFLHELSIIAARNPLCVVSIDLEEPPRLLGATYQART